MVLAPGCRVAGTSAVYEVAQVRYARIVGLSSGKYQAKRDEGQIRRTCSQALQAFIKRRCAVSGGASFKKLANHLGLAGRAVEKIAVE